MFTRPSEREGQLSLVYVQPLAELISVKIGYGCGWSEYIWGPVRDAEANEHLAAEDGLGHRARTRHAAVQTRRGRHWQASRRQRVRTRLQG